MTTPLAPSPRSALIRRSNEPRAAAELAFQGFEGLVEQIGETHLGVAERFFKAVGPAAEPVRLAHDLISKAAYGSIRLGGRAAGRAASAMLASTRWSSDRPISTSPGGAFALAALNGLLGDRLDRSGSELSVETSLRLYGGDPVELTREGIARAYPKATRRIAIFLHGLCENEATFSWFAEKRWGDRRSSHGERLARDLGYTPVYVRYNSGLRISENGRRISDLIERTLEHWPHDLDEIVLIGHSMGGLTARSAAHHGVLDQRAWPSRVRHVFCLGTPHLGAPLEDFAHRGAHRLDRLPETRALAKVIRLRSGGIRDLRFGYLTEEEWRDRHPDELLDDNRADVPFLEGAAHYFIGVTLTRDPDSPLGRFVGDLLVRYPSASGTGPDGTSLIPFELENGVHFGRMHHFDLLNDPAIYAQIHDWLVRGEADRAGRAALSP